MPDLPPQYKDYCASMSIYAQRIAECDELWERLATLRTRGDELSCRLVVFESMVIDTLWLHENLEHSLREAEAAIIFAEATHLLARIYLHVPDRLSPRPPRNEAIEGR